MGTILRGRVQIELDDVEGGLAQMSEGFAIFRSTDSAAGQTSFLSWLAEAQVKAGQVGTGLETLDQALKAAHQTGEQLYLAELYRLQGEFLQHPRCSVKNRLQQAEGSFHKALDIANHQQAQSWELRAATSLARLWSAQGKRQEAFDLLTPVYERFTEGFDTMDLQDTNRLLTELHDSLGGVPNDEKENGRCRASKR
jgi:predicted ATPase